MALRKIRGVKSYRFDTEGTHEMLNSPGLSRVMEQEADRIAGNANAVGDATYAGRPAPVRTYSTNEKRAGASVYVVEPHWRDSRDEVLKRTAEAMGRRSPRE